MHPIIYKLFRRKTVNLNKRIGSRYGVGRARCARCGWKYKQDDRRLAVCGSCYDLLIAKIRNRVLKGMGYN